MRYGLKTLLELSLIEINSGGKKYGVCINDGDLVVSITNNYKLTKGRVYRINKTTLSSQPYVIDDSGGFNFDMSVFVFECDWNKAIRDLKLRKMGI